VSEASPDTPPPGPDRRPGPRPVQYKGAPLEADRGPGLGCFWGQVIVLSVAVILTPLSVAWGWPSGVSAGLLLLVILLLFFTGQTVIFLLRLVAAERRATGRRRPLDSATRTVGELEDERQRAAKAPEDGETGPDGQGRMRQ
jgi:hypothetical protein